jgi:hypothetical protein
VEGDAAALHDRVGVGSLLLEGHRKAEGAVEGQDLLDRAAREDGDGLLGHAPPLLGTLYAEIISSALRSCEAKTTLTAVAASPAAWRYRRPPETVDPG